MTSKTHLALIWLALLMGSTPVHAQMGFNTGMFIKSKSKKCGGSIENHCYAGANAEQLKTIGTAITPLGKSLSWNATKGIWEESGGSRVLAADGFDAWAYQLNIDGRSYSSIFLDKANVAGRVCPTNVFVPGNLVATGKCLYYDAGNSAQSLDAAGSSQTLTAQIGLAQWDAVSSGNGTSGSWYEGNIQTCAAKGMRLPTLYETTTADPGAAKPTDASPIFSTASNGVPKVNNYIWTSSAFINLNTNYWMASSGGNSGYSNAMDNSVRCVTPAETAYNVTYVSNGANSGTVPAAGAHASGATVSVAANHGSLAKTGYSFAGWNTAANGSGSTYAANAVFTMSSANITLYAQWAIGCGGPGDSCYSSTAAKTAGTAITPSSKSLVYTNGVWVEKGGSRVLAADGSDAWANALSGDGRSYSSTLLDKIHIAGRACPTNVFVPGNLVATGRCLYYDAANANQRLDAPNNDGVTDQTTVGSIRLGVWNAETSGNSIAASWYEGNIQKCAAKGMRLPTLYETQSSAPASGAPADASPSFGGASLVPATNPSIGSTWTWTASAASDAGSGSYFNWANNVAIQKNGYDHTVRSVRCVAPGEGAYTVTYDSNGANSGSAPAPSANATGATVTVAANHGSLAKTGYSFAGWNTAPDGSGSNYVAGSGSFSMDSANITLYAKWQNNTCGTAGNSCYDNAFVMSLGTVTTPLGKVLEYVHANGSSGFKVWKEVGGTRVLRANGLDEWAKALNANGRGQSATDFTDANLGTTNTLIAGRSCPANVYIDDSNMVTTGNCVYYTPEYAPQRLDATANDFVTDQTTEGAMRLGSFNTSAGGNGTSASWYEGNIQTCAGKGMRLPTLYEVAVSDPGNFKPTDASPTFNAMLGVPSGSESMWTASAATADYSFYWSWSDSGATNEHCINSKSIRCVIP